MYKRQVSPLKDSPTFTNMLTMFSNPLLGILVGIAFTVSIDYAGTTTGISAEERGMTARHCISEDAKPEDFRRPGHMFPLLAKKNGQFRVQGSY